MAGQFYLSLLNPAMALSFGGVLAFIWGRLPSQGHLFPLSFAFLYLGLAFISQEVPGLSQPGAINYSANALFFLAVVLACASALMRAHVQVPLLSYGGICGVAALGFAWFAFVQPSTVGRIYFLNGCFVVLTILTAGKLHRAGLRTLPDRLFFGAVMLGAVLSIVRPALISLDMLDIGIEGGLNESAYWLSVLGLTPLLSITIVSIFLLALVLDLMASLRREADQDYLTGLLNRRGFELGASERLAGAGSMPAALLVADIDDFKQINDRFGHAVGDAVIAAVGRVLRQFGQADLAGRVGGEEFALFYAVGSRRTLENCAEAVRLGLAGLSVAGLPEGYRLSASMGLHLRHGSEGLDTMMRSADRALYDAKAAGKNRAVMAPVRLRSV